MKNSVFSIVFATLVESIAFCCHAESGDVCERIKNEKSPAAYLIDKNGNIDPGPVDYGTYFYVLREAVDYIYVPTAYRVVITPRRIVIDGILSGGAFELRPSKPICPNSTTYELVYAIRGFPVIRPEMLPRKEDKEPAQFPPAS